MRHAIEEKSTLTVTKLQINAGFIQNMHKYIDIVTFV